MPLRNFALLRKKKQREEEMTKNVQDTPSSTGVIKPSGGGKGGGGPNGIQVNPVGQVEELRNGKAMELKYDLVDLVDSYQGAFTSRNVVKIEVVDFIHKSDYDQWHLPPTAIIIAAS